MAETWPLTLPPSSGAPILAPSQTFITTKPASPLSLQRGSQAGEAVGDREVAGCLWGLLGGLVSSHGSELDPVLVQGCPRPQGTCACGVRGQHVCVHVTPCYPQGVYVCFQVHMEMVACWEGVRPPACAKAVSWEMRAGASRQVGGSVQPLGAGLCSQMSMHIYGGGLGPQASPWLQMQTLPLLLSSRSVVFDSLRPHGL